MMMQHATMTPFNTSHNVRPDFHRHRLLDPRFTHTDRFPALDHCTSFEHIVFRSAIGQHLSVDDDLVTRYNNMAGAPRSLPGAALGKEAMQRREHGKYMA